MKQTTMAFKNIKRKHYLVDAKGKIVGRLAVEIANALRGKDKPEYVPHLDCGDFVIVINAKDIVFTGKKWENKKYYSHSMKPGNLKERKASWVHEKDPTKILFKAVKGMLQKNRISKIQLTRLRIFEGEHHLYDAQKPIKVDSLRNRGEKNEKI